MYFSSQISCFRLAGKLCSSGIPAVNNGRGSGASCTLTLKKMEGWSPVGHSKSINALADSDVADDVVVDSRYQERVGAGRQPDLVIPGWGDASKRPNTVIHWWVGAGRWRNTVICRWGGASMRPNTVIHW